jgi:hypothetical protein
MARYTIEVTEEDIRKGQPQGVDDCPIALAIYRQGIVDGYEHIDVDKDGIHREGKRWGLRRASGRLPRAARQFIDDFDIGRPVAPFAFKLAIRD